MTPCYLVTFANVSEELAASDFSVSLIKKLDGPEKGSKFLQHISRKLPNNPASHPRRLLSSSTTLRRPPTTEILMVDCETIFRT